MTVLCRRQNPLSGPLGSTSILLVSLLLIFLFSDLPKLSAFTPFYLLRMSKKKWLAAQFVYIGMVTALYIGFVLIVTILLCMKYSFPGNLGVKRRLCWDIPRWREAAGSFHSEGDGEYQSLRMYGASSAFDDGVFPYAGFFGFVRKSSAGEEVWDASGDWLQFLWIFVGS